MASAELRDLVFHGREERNLEYKSSLNWKDSATKAKIVKACLAMTNIRDGGVIVLGVEQNGEDFDPVGMQEDDAASFSQDHVLAKVNEFADPFVELTVTPFRVDNGKVFVVIQVQEFAELPVICRKNGDQNLSRGDIYTRPRRMNETAQVSSQTEMREIIELATDKAMQKFITRQQRLGIPTILPASDKEKFDEQLEGL